MTILSYVLVAVWDPCQQLLDRGTGRVRRILPSDVLSATARIEPTGPFRTVRDPWRSCVFLIGRTGRGSSARRSAAFQSHHQSLARTPGASTMVRNSAELESPRLGGTAPLRPHRSLPGEESIRVHAP